jgi:hypothetical protein
VDSASWGLGTVGMGGGVKGDFLRKVMPEPSFHIEQAFASQLPVYVCVYVCVHVRVHVCVCVCV